MSRFLYLAVVPERDAYKIGVTDDPSRRWRSLGYGYGTIDNQRSWIVSFTCRGVFHVETLTHFALHQHRLPVREGFEGWTEWFALPSLPSALRVLRSLRDLRPDLGMHFWKADAFLHAITAPIGHPVDVQETAA